MNLDETIAKLNLLDPASVAALSDIADERLRQIEIEGWSASHDDEHSKGELAVAGACYALEPHTPKGKEGTAPSIWPWDKSWWKPKSAHSNWVRGAALIVAELAKRYRSAP